MSMNDPNWYALVVRPRSEKAVAQALTNRGVEGYLPVYRGRYRSGGRLKDVDLPLFPQYVFCKLGAGSHAHILATPGVYRFVAFGNSLAPVDSIEMQNIQRLVSSEKELQPWPFLKEGHLVEITEGPLSSLVGRLITINGDCKLILEISLLGRSVAVGIDRKCVRPISTSEPAFAGRHGTGHCVPSFVRPIVDETSILNGIGA